MVPEEKRKKWKVSVHFHAVATVVVEADNEEEAEFLAYDQAIQSEFDYCEPDGDIETERIYE